jgi:hypothetical protein
METFPNMPELLMGTQSTDSTTRQNSEAEIQTLKKENP